MERLGTAERGGDPALVREAVEDAPAGRRPPRGVGVKVDFHAGRVAASGPVERDEVNVIAPGGRTNLSIPRRSACGPSVSCPMSPRKGARRVGVIMPEGGTR